MSPLDSLALFRRSRADSDLTALADEHMRHELPPSDRDALRKGASQIANHTIIGSLLGLGLGVFMAARLRRARGQMFEAFKAREKPVEVRFQDGRTEPVPDIAPLLRPTTLGDFATYLFFSAGGLFIGGETGLLTGSYAANRTLTRDPDTKRRIEAAFRRFRADVLRREAERLDGGESVLAKMF
ncbi:hypothetical protein M432DRAFT_155862 [Thermoascus aurantiacus ATCC 26904]